MCQTTHSHRQCVICNRQLYGRSDKRFCDIKCKNYYHSEVRKTVRSVSAETMKILTNNVVILNGIMGEYNNHVVVDKLALERKGFKFNYVTDVMEKYGNMHFGVFNFTYRFGKSRRVMISVDKDRSNISPFIYERWSREFKETTTTKSYRFTPPNNPNPLLTQRT